MSCTTVEVLAEQHHPVDPQDEDWVIHQAIALLERRVFHAGPALQRPDAVRDFLRLKLAAEPNEVFMVIFLNAQSEVIAYEQVSTGTINQCAVYPRVVLQRALLHNAAAVILAHQHPSGTTDPSAADREVTQRLRSVLEVVDVRVLDHIVVGQGTPFSFMEAGLL